MSNTKSKAKGLLDLKMNDCRWPIGEPKHPDFHFCGAPQAPGRPYCARHWEMAFQPPRPRQAAPEPLPVTAPLARAKAA